MNLGMVYCSYPPLVALVLLIQASFVVERLGWYNNLPIAAALGYMFEQF
jgi:hypothetical protein